ncbi:MAG TPA: hypothetical protein VE954_29385 [Oligoflexus sp.]|uniref:hypothetical protein n=1 Tax=Oligoflexus sp. TaxID=1971216 RepID=UPI002D377F77|nr:hypothetical protein [Oligoflexus sp.]HYX37237.1 hypothetical protein [Oligoflexus sp.]
MRYTAALFMLAVTSINAFAGQGSGGGLGKTLVEMELSVMPVDHREMLLPADDMRRLKARLSVSEEADVLTDEGLLVAKRHNERIIDSSETIEFISN